MALFLPYYFKDSYDLNEIQKKLASDILKRAANKPGLEFLNDLPLNRINVKFCRPMNNEKFAGIVNGAFDDDTETIYISPSFDINSDNERVIAIQFLAATGTIIHELKHYWQKQTYGWLLYNLLSVVRVITLEPSAYAAEDIGHALCSEMTNEY